MTSLLLFRRAALRAVALCLLVLAASPCTAPFATFDPGSPPISAPADFAKAKISHDDVMPVRPVTLAPRTGDTVSAAMLQAAPRRHTLDAQHLILRL